MTAVALRGTPPPPGRSGRRGRILALAISGPLVAVIAVTLGLLLLLGGAGAPGCGTDGLPGDVAAPGTLGHVAGTGLTATQVRAVRAHSPYAGSRLTAGEYVSTAYGPPWGGIQGAGNATSGGLRIGGGSPRWYVIAVDPALIAHGQLAYLWPNPFGWTGPFLAADTGGAIHGRRIDFYDWRGRTAQHAWGTRTTHASPQPIHPNTTQLAELTLATGCDVIDTGGLGEEIGRIARSHLSAGPTIRGFQPPSVGYAWCAWFVTNVWRQAGVPIPVDAWSGYPYQWGPRPAGSSSRRSAASPTGRPRRPGRR